MGFLKRFAASAFEALIVILSIGCLASCEKHDGIIYFKSKCVAELNGQTLIDQTPFNISPVGMKTPSFTADERYAEFHSILSNERGGEYRYSFTINIYVDSPWEYLTETQLIKYVPPADSGDSEIWDYAKYCRENRISYARILSWTGMNDEVISEGSLEIVSYNLERKEYRGIFSLKFSEGTLKGEFSIGG